MQLKHIAQVSSTEENADRLYQDVLGLKKINAKMLPASLANDIFNVNAELQIINYANDALHFEIFINNSHHVKNDTIGHICLEVENLEAFLERCRQNEIEVIQVPKGDALITFIKDNDGGLFEIKEA
ncbi:MAG: VOC family protein [Deltaproteobacteria bacterium]|jgi:catechol 2,3-dioxygenase-like lactoylglutathione lyase family enzyme|nr:VOC family protein [Deltaproteobacteria bacterium]